MGDLTDWNHVISSGTAAPPHYGEPQHEFTALRTSVAVSPLAQFALLRFQGRDANVFLQGQLTCDLDQLTDARALFGGYCTPRGRLLASFLIWSAPQAYLMLLPADIAPGVAERLRRFVLRSQVTIEHARDLHMLGLAGPEAVAVLQQEQGVAPQGRLEISAAARATILRLPGAHFLLVATADDMPALWRSLTKRALPVGTQCWSAAQIEAGVPWISVPTQDQFLPQMIGLDEIGGVSYDKGCYTGQEIVARTHYLGEVKRKLRVGRTPGAVSPGDTLSSAGIACGTVLNTASIPGQGQTLLAVVSEPGEAVQTASGAPVEWSPLPGN